MYILISWPRFGMQCVIVAFPGHTHLHFYHKAVDFNLHCFQRESKHFEKAHSALIRSNTVNTGLQQIFV